MTIKHDSNDKKVFWGCFIALIATAFGFITRMLLLGRFQSDFAIDKVDVGVLQGAGVWPFAISIILFSLIIDKIGYRLAMVFSFVCYAVYLVMASMAYSSIQGVEGEALAAAQARGYDLLYWGSIILGLGNGTVEAFINPVVATMFRENKTKWLTILHAGWPGGLVLGGLITIAMSGYTESGDWRVVLGIIAIPAVIFFVMLINARFPVSEREQAGVSYREMLAEFGAFGALVSFGLIFAQLGQVFGWSSTIVWSLTAAVVVAFGVYTRSFGKPLLAILIVVMMPLATTEIGTDGWISSLMEKPLEEAGRHAGWVLVYTSAIMMVLRFFAGPIIHRISPIGILVISSLLAIAGLFALSKTGSASLTVIFAAATLYGVGKTFFWPTTLGIVAEQCPKGGALTLNAISGIGMIAVGILGFPFIGALQEKTSSSVLTTQAPAVAEEVMVEKSYLLGKYQGIDPDKKSAITDESALSALEEADKAGQFDALAKMTFFPAFMLICYLGIWLFFKSRGGYKPIELASQKELDAASEY
ncbi:MFS transporter [Verrucomicrobiaceae bacterium N1E253]|uniref:MFS transporter n=1 Tax=Oceaniferula marina TaxID=2748318 RepID=A0A851GJR2_9BACT|nr:MFS transporter [Oceaniferula marina]NWK57399.1 MFS transporter [Oceaniferula marina]